MCYLSPLPLRIALCCSGPALGQLALQILLPLVRPLAPAPLPVGHADESVAQQHEMSSLQQVGTRWRPARKEVIRTIELDCPRARAAAALASHPQGAAVHEHVDGKPRLWAANLVLHREPRLAQRLPHLLLRR